MIHRQRGLGTVSWESSGMMVLNAKLKLTNTCVFPAYPEAGECSAVLGWLHRWRTCLSDGKTAWCPTGGRLFLGGTWLFQDLHGHRVQACSHWGLLYWVFFVSNWNWLTILLGLGIQVSLLKLTYGDMVSVKLIQACQCLNIYSPAWNSLIGKFLDNVLPHPSLCSSGLLYSCGWSNMQSVFGELTM